MWWKASGRSETRRSCLHLWHKMPRYNDFMPRYADESYRKSMAPQLCLVEATSRETWNQHNAGTTLRTLWCSDAHFKSSHCLASLLGTGRVAMGREQGCQPIVRCLDLRGWQTDWKQWDMRMRVYNVYCISILSKEVWMRNFRVTNF